MTKPQNQAKAAVAKAAPVAPPAPVAPAKPIVFYVLEDWIAALGTFLIAGAVFLYNMCPSVTLQDSGELVTGAYRFGVPHPSGYPLWALLGWIWRHFVHIGDPAAQITSFSACTGAAVVALLTILTKRSTLILLNSIAWREPLEPLVARVLALCTGLFAGLMFAFNRGVWLWSCVPEMRILSVFMYMLTAFVFLKWMLQPERRSLLLAAVFIFGLGIANHQTTTVMLVPMIVGTLIVGVLRDENILRTMLNRWLAIFFQSLSPTGRLSGARYVFLTIPVCNLMNWFGFKIFYLDDKVSADTGIAFCLGAIVCYVYTVFQIIRRLHDLGRSGRESWYILIPIYNLWFQFCLIFKRGEKGPNRYGDDPLDRNPSKFQFCEFWDLFAAFLISWQVGVLINAWLAYTPPQPAPYQTAESITIFTYFLAFFMQKVKALILFGPNIAVLPLLQATSVGIVVLLISGGRLFRRRWVLVTTFVFALGIAFYLYMPIAASTNPPMNWGFTTTREGFLHHITRGQYQKLSISSPLSLDFLKQNFLFLKFLCEQFTYILAPLALATMALFFAFWNKVSSAGRKVLVFGWTAFITTSLGLIFIINPGVDAQNWGIACKFFAPAHGFFAMLIGYALALMLAWLWTQRVPQRVTWVGLGCLVMLIAWSWPLRSNWEACEQRNHDFGYQFGFRMFHPGGGYPDMDQDAVLYGGTDPGRFVPTYMIFCESFTRPQDRYVSTNMTEKGLMEKCATFDRRDVYIITQNALADGTYMNYIRDHYDFTRPNPDKPETIAKFAEWQQAIMRFAWKRMGRDVTYPKEPIFIPSPAQANDAFRQFVEDVQTGRIQPGADVRVENGRVSVEGVQGVMAINGILAKWIFEKNKDKHSFYVEESYVIPWMYPYLKPSGIIMKIEKEPLPTPQQDANYWQALIEKDFKYWDMLLGEFIKRPEFKRDSDAQKAFSKLRCAIAGVYEFRGIVNAAEAAYMQAIAICPESPEASFRLANLYMRLNRVDKAVETLGKLAERDPFNKQVREALDQFRSIQNAMTPAIPQPSPFPIIKQR